MANPTTAALLLMLLAAAGGAAAAGARGLLQAPRTATDHMTAAPAMEAEAGEYSMLVPAQLEVRAACTPKYTCPGVGPQIYTCNGTAWVNTNSSVAFKCTGTSVTGVHSVIAEVPSYTFNCGFAQGNTTGQIMVPGPGAKPSDLPIYRRAAFNTSGCVSGIAYITRSKTVGGVPSDPKCAMKGKTEGVDYTADFTFWDCPM